MTAQWELSSELDATLSFRIVTAFVRRAQSGQTITSRTGVAVGARGEVTLVAPERGLLWVDPDEDALFGARVAPSPEAAQILLLYLPLCLGPRAESLVIAHLGQSLDGRIATQSGASRYVTGHENLTHIHRLRALCDAIVVGVNTVECDDPQLTTRLVEGPNPVRVVVDPELRSSRDRRVFSDGSAPTWVVCERGRSRGAAFPRGVELIELDAPDGELKPESVVAALVERGKRWVFVEGGGVTVSRFLAAGALDRLHLTVAPLFLGAGVPALSLPPLCELERALRPQIRRFTLGDDVLFDCRLVRGAHFGVLGGDSQVT